MISVIIFPRKSPFTLSSSKPEGQSVVMVFFALAADQLWNIKKWFSYYIPGKITFHSF